MSASVMLPPLALTQYEAAAFDGLPHFEAALISRPLVEEAAAAAATLFRGAGLKDIAGIAMLHQHFHLAAGEVLLERKQGADRVVVTPVPVAEAAAAGARPYMFKVAPRAGGGFRYVPLEFAAAELVDPADLDALAAPAFIDALGALLEASGGLNIVGVALLRHRGHVAAVDGSTMELTDELNRALTIMPQSHVPAPRNGEETITTRTVWTFGDRAGEDACRHCVHCSHR